MEPYIPFIRRMRRINGRTTFALGWHGLMKASTWSGA
jgi:hypothetical protein